MRDSHSGLSATTVLCIALLCTVNACTRPGARMHVTEAATGQLPLHRVEGPFGSHNWRALRESARLVVRDSVQWRRLWDGSQEGSWPQHPVPPVDFSREVILVAALGEKPQGVYHVAIDSAVPRHDVIEVHVSYSVEPSCKMIFSVAWPGAAARLAVSPGQRIEFVDHVVRDAC